MEKTTKAGRTYRIDGKTITWTPEPWPGEPQLPDLVLPLRLKFGRLIDLADELGGETSLMASNKNVLRTLELIAPRDIGTVREMDPNEVQDMFATWFDEYNSLNGTNMGERSASPASAGNIEALSSMSGGNASASA